MAQEPLCKRFVQSNKQGISLAAVCLALLATTAAACSDAVDMSGARRHSVGADGVETPNDSSEPTAGTPAGEGAQQGEPANPGSAPPMPPTGTWPNEPTGSSVLVDCSSFPSKTCGSGDMPGGTRLWDIYGGGGVQNIAGPSGAMTSVYYDRLPANAAGGDGSGLTYYKTGAATPALYVGFHWKMNADFQGGYAFNKLFFVRTFNNPAGGALVNGVFNIEGPQGYTSPFHLIWGANTDGYDNSHACAEPLGATCRTNRNDVPLYRNTWYLIEAYVKASTSPTARNATVRWWINGVLAGDYTNLNYGGNVMNEFTFDHTWDGAANVDCAHRDCSKEWRHYIADLRISAAK